MWFVCFWKKHHAHRPLVQAQMHSRSCKALYMHKHRTQKQKCEHKESIPCPAFCFSISVQIGWSDALRSAAVCTRLCKETCWLFHNFSLGSGNEGLSHSDRDAKLGSSKARDPLWRATPRRQLAWHIRPTAAASQERSALGGIYTSALCLVYVRHCRGSHRLVR